MKDSITCRPAESGDEHFLYKVYAASREDELSIVGWTDAEKDAFLRMQFSAQHTHYHTHYADADFLIILQHGKPVGRIYLARWEKEIRIIDIALLPQYRNKGLGAGLIREIQEEAGAAGKTVTGHVEKFNPAIRFYQRLGFDFTEDRGVHWFMEWPAKA